MVLRRDWNCAGMLLWLFWRSRGSWRAGDVLSALRRLARRLAVVPALFFHACFLLSVCHSYFFLVGGAGGGAGR